MKDLIQEAYDPERFRKAGHYLVDLLADHLKEAQEGTNAPVINWRSPDEQVSIWEKEAAQNKDTPLEHWLGALLRDSIHLHQKKYMGHQISPPAPAAVLAGFLGDFMNNGMGVYEMGGPSTAIERLVIRAVAKAMGFGEMADGVLTSGGTLANLTALLAARSIKGNGNVWKEGHNSRLALMVSEEAHYCVDRAVRIMGWGEEGIIKVPVNERYEIRTDLLETYYQQAMQEGKEVIAVVGSACTTSTGSFDNLEALAAFCQQFDLWFHIDGAHGGPLVFSGKYRSLVRGIEKADSVAMDFHKMLLTPSITTALLFKDGRHSYQTFAQKAQYLWGQSAEPEWYNLAKRTFECTKLMLSIKAFSLIRTYGTALFDQYVTRVIDLTRHFGELIREKPHFQLAMEPQCNIICFRYFDASLSALENNAGNEQIRQHLLEEGTYYIVKTILKETVWLRCTLTNPFTTEEELKGLLSEIEHKVGLIVAS